MKRSLFLGITLLVAIIPFTGCSPSGWAVKSLPDGSALDRGESVAIVQRDGSTIDGIYEGLEMIPAGEYLEQYSAGTRDALRSSNMPAIGQKVRVLTTLADDKVWEGRLIGFDHRSLWLSLDGRRDPVEFYISTLMSLTGRDKGSFGRMKLRELYLGGDIPLMSALVLKSENGTIRVPVSSIRELKAGLLSHAENGFYRLRISGDAFRSSIAE